MPFQKGDPKPKTGGRQKGTPNKVNQTARQLAASTGLLPHEMLLAVARGQVIDGHIPTWGERLNAMEKAAPYYAAKLAQHDVTAKVDAVVNVRIVQFGHLLKPNA